MIVKRYQQKALFIVIAILHSSSINGFSAFPITQKETATGVYSNLQLKNEVNDNLKLSSVFKSKNEKAAKKSDNGITGILALLLSLIGVGFILLFASVSIFSWLYVILGVGFAVAGIVLGAKVIRQKLKNEFLAILAVVISSLIFFNVAVLSAVFFFIL